MCITGYLIAAAQKLQSLNGCGEGDREIEGLRFVHGLPRDVGTMVGLAGGFMSRKGDYK